MKKVLVINSSARSLNSQSRTLTELSIDYWKSIHIGSIISFREPGNTDVPILTTIGLLHHYAVCTYLG